MRTGSTKNGAHCTPLASTGPSRRSGLHEPRASATCRLSTACTATAQSSQPTPAVA
ncbi:hypothetical protein SF06_23470 [Pseudomonas flexibilis]|nr:hypothetical protein SF06_23470 [Pseudomonas flexibilis]